MNTGPKVTILLATYNRAHLILQALRSIQSQTYDNWEALIIDDGSTDNTEEALKPILREDRRFKYFKRLPSYKKGLSGSRNYGLDMAKGDYIIFFDDDDIVHPQNLGHCLSAIHSSNADFCHYQKQSFLSDVPKIELEQLKIKGEMSRKDLEQVVIGKLVLASCTVLWKKECFSQVRFNDTLTYAEEWECYTNIIEKGFKGIVLENTLYFNRKHAISNTGKFWRNDPKQRSSKKEAILLVAQNLANKDLLNRSVIKYFTGLAISYRDLKLLKRINMISKGKRRDFIFLRIKYHLFPFWRLYYKFMKLF